MRMTIWAAACGMLLAGGVLAAGPIEAQQRATPQQPAGPRPVQSPAAQDAGFPDRVTCKDIRLHYTARGIAFDCVDAQAGTNLVIVIDDSRFPGGGAAMVPMLDRLSQASRDPQRPGILLTVRHRPAGEASLAVCSLMQRRSPGNRDCREAVFFHE